MKQKILAGALVLVACVVALIVLDMCGVFANQASPSALLTKYEQFKDQSAALDAKLETLSAYRQRYDELVKQYGQTPRSQWDRVDKEQVNQWCVEVAGLVGSYNTLAAEYNADMAKINYRFCNVGDLPQGAKNPLPREYKPYINTIN